MANMLYFHSDKQLDRITSMENAEFAKRFPGQKGKRYDSFAMLVGSIGEPAWNGSKWEADTYPVQRVIEFKRNPSLHKCDMRCTNARDFKCECSCRGKNHGAGNFVCE